MGVESHGNRLEAGRSLASAEYVLGESVSPTAQQKERRANQPGRTLHMLGVGSQILRSAGCGPIRVMTNRPKHIVGSEGFGISVVDQIPIPDHGF